MFTQPVCRACGPTSGLSKLLKGGDWHLPPRWSALDATLWGFWMLSGCQYLVFQAAQPFSKAALLWPNLDTELASVTPWSLNDRPKYSYDLRWREFEESFSSYFLNIFFDVY